MQGGPPPTADMSPPVPATAWPRVRTFTRELLAALPRADQRRWGELYLRGLLLVEGRKTSQHIAESLAAGREQNLQQFVNQSTWDWAPVRRRLGERVTLAAPPQAWVIGESAFPKAGPWSVGVERQYAEPLGRTVNCQIGVSANVAAAAEGCPLSWRLFLPPRWDHDHERRRRVHLPRGERHRPKWRLALELVDELLEGWTLPVAPVVAGVEYGIVPQFRAALEARGLPYLLRVPASTAARLAEAAPGRRARRRALAGPQPEPQPLPALAAAAGAARRRGARRAGLRGELRRSQFQLLPVRLPGEQADHWASPVRLVLAQWPIGAGEPTAFWLSNLRTAGVDEHAALAAVGELANGGQREVQEAVGLGDFEGRSFRGWHHHVTLVSIAQAFIFLERLRQRRLAALAGRQAR